MVNIAVSTVSPSIALTVAGTVSGTSDHRKLTNRDAPEQHPIRAVAGLQEALPDVLSNLEILDILNA